MEKKALYESSLPPLGKNPTFPSRENQSYMFSRRNRLFGGAFIIINLLIFVLAGYGLLMSDAMSRFTWIFPAFSVLIIIYSILCVVLIVYMSNSAQSSSNRHSMLQKVLDSYQRRTTELQVAATIARDASAETSMGDVIERAVSLITLYFGFYHAAIFLTEKQDDGFYAVMRAAAGSLTSQNLAEQKHRLLVGSKSLVGYATQTGQARIALDVQTDNEHWVNPALPHTRSEMTVPLRIGEEVIGALDVQSQKEDAFTQNDIAIMQVLADLLATIINKTKLNEQVHQYAQTLEERVAERTSALNREKAHLNAILHAMREGVIYYEGQKVHYINNTFTDLTAYDATNWQGLHFLFLNNQTTLSLAQQQAKDIETHLRDRGIWRGETLLRRKNGTETEIHVTAVRIESDDKQGNVLVLRDISHEKQLQEQRGRFVAYASHELRTPIANLKTRLYLMKKQPEQLERHHNIIDKVVNRMQRLVEDLLTVSRAERGTLPINVSLCALQTVIQGVIELQLDQANKKQQTLALQMPELAVNVLVDEDRITQVVTNLVSNAINYTPEKGHITVVLERTADNKSAEIRVEDTGVGIPPDALEHIFMPFYRADNVEAHGTGLGLNITQQIVELHQGQIRVESELGKGSTFIVHLPLIHGDTQEMAQVE